MVKSFFTYITLLSLLLSIDSLAHEPNSEASGSPGSGEYIVTACPSELISDSCRRDIRQFQKLGKLFSSLECSEEVDTNCHCKAIKDKLDSLKPTVTSSPCMDYLNDCIFFNFEHGPNPNFLISIFSFLSDVRAQTHVGTNLVDIGYCAFSPGLIDQIAEDCKIHLTNPPNSDFPKGLSTLSAVKCVGRKVSAEYYNRNQNDSHTEDQFVCRHHSKCVRTILNKLGISNSESANYFHIWNKIPISDILPIPDNNINCTILLDSYMGSIEINTYIECENGRYLN